MMGRYKSYPEYMDSGVEWIGSIPNNWSVSKLGYLINTIVPMRDKPTSLEGEIPWIRIEDFDGKYIFSSKSGQGVTESTINEFNLKVFPVGTVLCTCSCSMGTTAIVASPLISNQTFIGLLPGEKLDSEYLYYLMQASEAELTSKSAGAIQKYLSQDEFKALRFGFPSLNEQRIIANFLDHETAKIDTLIEKQQQLIKLLKEKRQAVISHAVTKGLNPNAKMRDSRVEWLREVPEHWIVTQPRYICSFVGGGTPAKENPAFWDGEIPWVSPKDMKSDYISNAQDKITPAAVMQSAAKLIDAGAVLIVVRGMILDHSIPVALSKVVITINQDMKALIPNHEINGEYLLYCLKGMRDNMLDLVESSAHGTKCLRTEQFDRMELPLPPLNEQLNIVSQLKKELERIDKLVLNTISMIELAAERRTALISAAVTGKIDVRDWQAPNG